MKIFQRVLHAVAVVTLGLAALVAALIIMLSIFVSKAKYVEGKMQPADLGRGWIIISVLLILIVLVACGLAIWRRAGWRTIFLAGSAVAVVFGFLAWDSAPVPLADLGPRVGEDDAGYRTIMWLSVESPYGRLAEAGILNSEDFRALMLPKEKSERLEHVRKNREAIFQAWEADKLGREWVDALIAIPPKGVWPQPINSPLVAFKQLRATCCIRAAYAYVLASEGRCDEAAAILIPMLEATHQLQRTGQGILNSMITTVIVKMNYTALAEVIELGPITTDHSLRLKEVLCLAPTIQQRIRNTYLGEHEFLRGCMDGVEGKYVSPSAPKENVDRWIRRVMGYGGKWLLFNRNRTEFMGLEELAEASALAEARDITGLKNLVPVWKRTSEWKNPVGRITIAAFIQSPLKIAENIWQVEDQRLALLKQLEKP